VPAANVCDARLLRTWSRAGLLLAILIAGIPWGEARCAEMLDPKASEAGRFLEFALSPDGSELAEVLRAKVSGQSREAIVLTKLTGRSPVQKTVYWGTGVSMLKWVNENVIGFVDSGNSRVIIEEDVHTSRLVRSIAAPGDILDFTADPSGKNVAYMFRDWTQANMNWVSRSVPDRIGVLAVALPKWAIVFGRWGSSGEAPTGVGISGVQKAKPPMMRITPFDVHQLAWYGSPPRAVMLRQTGAQSLFETSVLDIASGATVVGPNRLTEIWHISGSSSGVLALVASAKPRDIVPNNTLQLYIATRAGRLRRLSCFTAKSISGVWWGKHNVIWVEAQRSDREGTAAEGELIAVDWRNDRIVREIGWPEGTLSDCQMDRSTEVAACLAETLTTSAQLVKIDLNKGSSAILNGLWNPIETSDVTFREIYVRNKFGELSDGFLALPGAVSAKTSNGAEVNITYPLAVMLYGFDRSFARDGQWVQAYPVERMVHSGIAVLLLNLPEEFDWRMGDTATARLNMVEKPLSTVFMAPRVVRRVVRDSGARIGRVMLMGWSWGGLLAAHAVERSCDFVAAEIGDPAYWNETGYSLYNAAARDWDDWLFGGPPSDKYIGNYLAFDPMHSGKRPHAPILFEFVSRDVAAGQYLEEWRASGADVQAFVYNRSFHFLNVASEAAISRERNLAWAKINLFGRKSVSPRVLADLGLTMPAPFRCGQ